MNVYPFGGWLEERRRKVGLTQKELGARLGVSQQTVQEWESGGSMPSPRRLSLLAEALAVTPEELGAALVGATRPAADRLAALAAEVAAIAADVAALRAAIERLTEDS